MKLSYNWLKEFVDINVTPDQLAQDLNSFGHEVEEVKKVGTCPEERRERSSKARRTDDWILDLSITANRGDCLSVLGIAREIVAFYNTKLKTKNLKLKISESKINKNIIINVLDSSICPRYSARIIDNIKVSESPKWIQDRLKLVGFRPINNIVDITNLAMIETGQPLHAFDYDKIHDRKMNIRLAKIGESVITLDGKNRQLDENSVIIEDGKKIFDLAGIMGGANSEVDDKTKTIILQAAIFDKKLIRATSKKLNHITDASYRYERGVDYNSTIPALNTATQLILKDCPSGKSEKIIDIKSQDEDVNSIYVEVNKINNLLGTNLTSKQIIDYLSRLNIIPNQPFDYAQGRQINQSTDKLEFSIPSYRQYDISIWQDLAEEVARVHGYNNLVKKLPDKLPRQSAVESASVRDQYVLKEYLKDILVESGFTEIYSYSFTDKKLMQLLGINLNNCRRVINSVAPELEYLRYDLRPSILSAVAKNPWAPEIKIFEIGKVFRVNPRPNPRQSASEEKWQLTIAECSRNGQGIKQVLDKLGIISDIITPDQKVLDYLKIRRPVRYVIIDLDSVIKHLEGGQMDSCEVENRLNSTNKLRYKSISQFPPTIRDLAFIVAKNIDAEQIRSHISSLPPASPAVPDSASHGRRAKRGGRGSSHILFVELFDEFHFPSTKSTDENQRNLCNKKNIAYHIWLQDLKGSMKEKEVQKIINKIVNIIENKFKAKLRS